MVLVQILAKNDKLRYLNPSLGKLGVTHDFGLWLFGKPMVDFLFALIEFFSYLLRFRSYEAKCVQLGCFHNGSTSLHSNFTWTGSSAITHSWDQETRDTGLANGLMVCIPSFWHNTGVWWMDDAFAVAYTALANSFAARCKNLCISKWSVQRVKYIC